MKKLIFGLIVLVFCACGSSKKKAEQNGTDTSLQQRLDDFLEVTDKMDLEKIMDYTYPKLFTIVPRAQLVEAMREGFDNAEVKVEMDSLRVDSLYPVFQVGEGSYAKVKYSMVMHMTFRNSTDSTDEGNPEQTEIIRQSLATKYGEENVSVTEATGIINIRTISPMVAIKDEHSKEWTFVNLKEEDPLITKLFSKEVLDKLATYK